jgi:phosphoglycerate dehydrogenase-like enzyme
MEQKIRVLLLRKFFDEDLAYIRAHLSAAIELVAPAQFTPQALAEAADGNIQAMLGEPQSKEILDNARDLKLIQIPWTGVDRLNFQLLRRYHFTVCNSHSNARVVAEYAVSMMLAAAKWIPLHDRFMRCGKWCRPTPDGKGLFLPPEQIHGRSVGILGFGAIGQSIADMLSGFSVSIHAVDAKPFSSAPAGICRIVEPDRMTEVVAAADFLFVTVPLTENTRGMINRTFFKNMKPTSYFINTSRGEVVVEEDLYTALRDRLIAGAAIDTWYKYPTADNPETTGSDKFPFQELNNIVMSPHRAGFAKGLVPHLDDAIENLNRLAAGRELINVVDLNAGY